MSRIYHARGFRGMKFGFFLRMNFVDTFHVATEHRIVAKSNVIKEKEEKNPVSPISFLYFIWRNCVLLFLFARTNVGEYHAAGGSMEIHEKEEERRERTSHAAACRLHFES